MSTSPSASASDPSSRPDLLQLTAKFPTVVELLSSLIAYFESSSSKSSSSRDSSHPPSSSRAPPPAPTSCIPDYIADHMDRLEEGVYARLSDYEWRQEEIRVEAQVWHGEVLRRIDMIKSSQDIGFASIESRFDDIFKMVQHPPPPPPGLEPSDS
ncbi:uncharacterized protein A4U43_C08F17210 [Asparagus officinalis]|nr:uncharacterized protein A4U43_C08F17210 [Asparagus officinalis]